MALQAEWAQEVYDRRTTRWVSAAATKFHGSCLTFASIYLPSEPQHWRLQGDDRRGHRCGAHYETERRPEPPIRRRRRLQRPAGRGGPGRPLHWRCPLATAGHHPRAARPSPTCAHAQHEGPQQIRCLYSKPSAAAIDKDTTATHRKPTQIDWVLIDPISTLTYNYNIVGIFEELNKSDHWAIQLRIDEETHDHDERLR